MPFGFTERPGKIALEPFRNFDVTPTKFPVIEVGGNHPIEVKPEPVKLTEPASVRPDFIQAQIDLQQPDIPQQISTIPGVETGNFIVTLVGSGSDIIISISPGYVTGRMPTLSGTPLDDGTPPTVTKSATGMFYVWLEVNATLTVLNDFVTSGYIDSVIVGCNTSIPADDPAGATFIIPIATIVDGTKTDQAQNRSIYALVYDAGTNNGDGVLLYY